MKKLNNRQKATLAIGTSLILILLIVWIAYGAEFWTKTQVLVEVKDEIFDSTYKEYRDQFVLGLEYTLLGSGIIFVFTIVTAFFQRDKKAG